MVTVKIGDLFSSTAQTLVNTVNCVGVMGKGIALKFKERFPEMFKDYEARCARAEVKLGEPYLFKRLLPPWILNFPTKDHWRSVTKLHDISRGLEFLLRHYRAWGITSLAVPPLGCGSGQLEWRVVGPSLYRYLSQMGIPVELYAPHGTPHEELRPDFLGQESVRPKGISDMPAPQWIPPGWVALVDILYRIEGQPYHWPVGRTTFQKIAYVATAEGVPTQLHFKQGSFGPFAAGLKAMETRLVNNGLIREERLGQRMLMVKVGPTFPDARKAYAEDLERLQPILERTAELFTRVDTAQAEITATILFASRSLNQASTKQPTEREVLDAVLRWKQRRRPPLDPLVVALSIRNMAALRWLDVRASNDLPLPDEDLVSV